MPILGRFSYSYSSIFVIPANAGIQQPLENYWIAAFTGMTLRIEFFDLKKPSGNGSWPLNQSGNLALDVS